ncbi:MAG: TIGR02391 family protein [Bacteroidetes bacterium]|nr:TIGR02391 family protein [Bacteroidota bacterium]MCO5277879.1 TIGR02391 family protein [Saprospiraceae bacterium]
MAKAKKTNKAEIEAKIEYQKVIGDVDEGGYQPIRFTRIKYKAAHDTHIDIRKFQRAPGDYDEGEVDDKFYPTKFGFRFPESEFIRVIKEYTLMPQTYVHPEIIKKSFKLLNTGHYESAVLQAFKCIETKIRNLTNSDPEEVGIKLIRKAFHPETGKLTDYKLPISEREAFSNYIAGAFGYYKNPCSHRDVELDYLSTFDRIVVASDLLKTIEKSGQSPF